MITARRQTGLTLIELMVVIIIVGVLAAIAMPRYTASVEKGKAGEAVTYLAEVAMAQELYHARNAHYADDILDLDIGLPELAYFNVGPIVVPAWEASLETGWQLTLTRAGTIEGHGAGAYGPYTLTWTHEGFYLAGSSVPIQVNPLQVPES